MEIIYLTDEGYNEYLTELEKLKQKLKENNMAKRSSYEEAPGDGWHDNFVFEDIVRQEDNLITRIENLVKLHDRIKIIKRTVNSENVIDIGDKVELELIYSDGTIENDIFELNANYKTKSLQEISVNSTLGKAIYLKRINDTFSYKTNNQEVRGRIISKIVS